MSVGVVDSGATVLHAVTGRSLGLTTEELLSALERELLTALDAHPEAVAVGLGIPCTIDRERGVAINAVNLPIVDVPIRDLIHERTGMPVFVDNDANVAVLAEHLYGAARAARNVVLLTLGTGIGGGLIVDGQVYRGSTGAGAELGHMVVDLDGPECQGSCPSHGCLESVASGTALAREGIEQAARIPRSALGEMLSGGAEIDARAVVAAAGDGDEAGCAAVTAVGSRLGTGLADLANIFEPDVIVIGGGAAAAGDLLLDPARAELRARALPPQNRTPVLPAQLGPDAGMIGAAAMALIELEGEG